MKTAGLPEDKGEFGGSCNRSACLAPHAVWYNHSTRLYYCTGCAQVLNYENRIDALQLYGHELCTYGLFEQRMP
jgi:hypothetical protein